MFDSHANLIVSAITIPPDPASSGTGLQVTTGEGSIFPAPPFNATVFPADAAATRSNAEIVRVTSIFGDALTIVRAQESTTARTILVGDRIALTVTAKSLQDIEAATGQLTVVAAEDIPAFSVVTSKGRVADSANPSATFGKIIGIAPTAIAIGFSGAVVESGDVTNGAWAWTVGDLVFLNGTALSTTAPTTGFVQAVGTARAPTVLVVDLGMPILL